MSIPLELVGVLLCMLAEAFFSGMETGIVSINRHRLLHLVRSGSVHARLIEEYLRDTQRLLGTTLVGTNLCLVVGSTLASSVAARNGGELAQTAMGILMSLCLLTFCEFLPKVWFSSRPIQRCLPLAGVLRQAERVLWPVARTMMFMTRWASPRRQQDGRSPFITRESIHLLARDSEAGGQITAIERLMITRVLDLQVKTAEQAMTPRAHITHVHADDTVDACFDRAKSSGHIRFPVFEADNMTCVGFLNVIEILSQTAPDGKKLAREVMHPPFFVAPDLRADDLLPLLRRQRQPMAMVKSATGQVLGLITQENILSAIMGNLPASGRGAEAMAAAKG